MTGDEFEADESVQAVELFTSGNKVKHSVQYSLVQDAKEKRGNMHFKHLQCTIGNSHYNNYLGFIYIVYVQRCKSLTKNNCMC